MRLLARAPLALASLTIPLSIACSSTTHEGGLIIGIDTNVRVPEDIDSFSVGVRTGDGQEEYANAFGLSPHGQLTFPATITLAGASRAGQQVQVRVVGYDASGKAHIVRDAVVTIPTSGLSELRLTLSALSFDHDIANGSIPSSEVDRTSPPMTSDEELRLEDGTNGFDSFFDVSTTCDSTSGELDGQCQRDVVTTVAPYAATDFYPNGIGAAQPCFDASKCFEGAKAVTLDPMCGFAFAGDPTTLNVGIVRPGGAGFCAGTICVAPLDSDAAHGFVAASGRVQLPQGVCATENGKANANVTGVVMQTGACPAKLPSLPIKGAGALCTN